MGRLRISKPEESQTDLGTVKIHKNAIASATFIATSEIEGVKNVGEKSKCVFFNLNFRRNYCNIKVEFDKNQEIRVEVPVVIKYGYNIPDIASRIQDNVRTAIEKMTDLSVRDVNVDVRGIEKE